MGGVATAVDPGMWSGGVTLAGVVGLKTNAASSLRGPGSVSVGFLGTHQLSLFGVRGASPLLGDESPPTPTFTTIKQKLFPTTIT